MKDLIKKSDKDLMKDIESSMEALRTFRFNISGGKVKNMKEGKNLKRAIAQMKGILASRKNA